MKKTIAILILAMVIPFAVIAGGNQENAGEAALTGSVKIAGSSTVYPVTTAMAEEFSMIHPKVEIPVQSTGSGGGFKNFFIPGKTAINNASRAIKDSEMNAARENGIEPIEFQVGIDAVTVVVNRDFPADEITIEQLEQIWRPENPAMKWSDVDPSWPDTTIELYGPTSASGTFDFFTEEVMGEGGASRSDYQGTEQDNTIVQAVYGSSGAMGYFGMAYYLENRDKVKALKVNGVMPSIESAKAGEYILSRPLFIYVSSKALSRPEVVEFVRFYLERTGDDLIKEIGYVPMTAADVKSNLERFESAVAAAE